MFCLSHIVSAEGDTFGDPVLNALKGAVYAAIVGSAVGFLASRAVRWSLRSGWAEPASLRLAGFALPFPTYAASVLVGGNGFVAAFVAGLWYTRVATELSDDSLGLVEDVSHLLALAAWYAFGALTTGAFNGGHVLRYFAYAFLVLVVARSVPVIASLTGAAFSRPERAAIGWLGPRGVTSIVFSVLAFAQLKGDEADFIVNVTAATVLLGVLLHGVTAEPIARWFARHPQPEEPAAPAET